jgi:2'-5' RNA ligase
MTRTFVAIELGDAARAHLAREMARLGRALPGVRWVDPNGVHLTLAFLGELDDTRLAAVYAASEEVAPLVEPFVLTAGRLGAFGTERAPRVVWMGVEGAVAQLARLRMALVEALAARGFARDARPFAPHLTLARLRTPPTSARATQLWELVREQGQRGATASIEARQLSVMRSELTRPVARYTCLRAVPLGSGPRPERSG